jgi:hypothetical protein
MMKLALALLILIPSAAQAHQPVMDMAPRWSGGYGFQTRYETTTSRRLEQGGEAVANPQGLRSESQTQWFEGVYTFHRSYRVTFKLPYEHRSARLLKDGQVRDVKASGLGDMILAFPIKRYVNHMTYTTNLALNPSVTLPTGSTDGPLLLGRGTVDYGLSVSLAREAIHTFGLWDLFGKVHTKGADGKTKGNQIGFDMNFGVYPYQNSRKEFASLLLWGTHLRQDFRGRLSDGSIDSNSGGRLVEMAPILVLLYKNLAFRTEVYFPVYRRLNGTQLVNDYRFQAGIGITFPSLTPF